MSSGLTGLGDQCFYKCGRDHVLRFSCNACSGPDHQAVQFLVCNECRDRTQCFHCWTKATSDCFRTDSDQSSTSSSSTSGKDARVPSAKTLSQIHADLADQMRNFADQMRNFATVVENITTEVPEPEPDTCIQLMERQIALEYAKDALDKRLLRILGRPVKPDDVVYNTLQEDGRRFHSEVTTLALYDGQGQPLACRGQSCENPEDAEGYAALALLWQLRQDCASWKKRPSNMEQI